MCTHVTFHFQMKCCVSDKSVRREFTHRCHRTFWGLRIDDMIIQKYEPTVSQALSAFSTKLKLVKKLDWPTNLEIFQAKIRWTCITAGQYQLKTSLPDFKTRSLFSLFVKCYPNYTIFVQLKISILNNRTSILCLLLGCAEKLKFFRHKTWRKRYSR